MTSNCRRNGRWCFQNLDVLRRRRRSIPNHLDVQTSIFSHFFSFSHHMLNLCLKITILEYPRGFLKPRYLIYWSIVDLYYDVKQTNILPFGWYSTYPFEGWSIRTLDIIYNGQNKSPIGCTLTEKLRICLFLLVLFFINNFGQSGKIFYVFFIDSYSRRVCPILE